MGASRHEELNEKDCATLLVELVSLCLKPPLISFFFS